MSYDYKKGKKRISDILINKLEVKAVNKIPSDNEFTFDNGYYAWVTAIFIDIRDSSKIFDMDNKEKTSKIIRSFTSEIIEVLRANSLYREIGIRGDCVYAIYTTPTQEDVYDCYTTTSEINTLLNMLNKLLEAYGFNNIRAGIGMSTSKELVIKAGRKDAGINSKVWIGGAVTRASNLSSLGDKSPIRRIVLSGTAQHNIFEHVEKKGLNDQKSWFKQEPHKDYGPYYHGSVVDGKFNEWVSKGMLDD